MYRKSVLKNKIKIKIFFFSRGYETLKSRDKKKKKKKKKKNYLYFYSDPGKDILCQNVEIFCARVPFSFGEYSVLVLSRLVFLSGDKSIFFFVQ